MGVLQQSAVYRDSDGTGWQITITYGDIVRVMRHVQTADNRPLDLCAMAETGNLTPVTDHLHVLVKCVYWLLQPAIIEHTGLNGIQAQEWFYDRVDADALESMSKALLIAITNFTPSPTIKAAIMTAGELADKAAIVTAIESLAGLLNDCTITPAL